MKDNSWTTEGQVRDGKISNGRPKRWWRDDIQWQGDVWSRKVKHRQKWRDLIEGYFQQ